VTDLLLQAGGFSAIVLDMGSIAPEYARVCPGNMVSATEPPRKKTRRAYFCLTQHACAKSSAVSSCASSWQTHSAKRDRVHGFEYCVEVARERFKPVSTNVIPLRKPPQRATDASWQSRTAWAGAR